MAASIRNIALAAGVSTATVSRVLSGSRPVRPHLREQVLTAAENLGYRPNSIARSLRLHRTHTLGVIVPTITNPYYAEMVRAMHDAASRYDYTLLMSNSDRNLHNEELALKRMIDQRVDGIALVTAAAEPYRELSLLVASNTPLVMMDRELEVVSTDRVLVDTRRATIEAMTHLIQRGRRRIALITGPLSVATSAEKLTGYRDALQASGLKVEPDLILEAENTPENGERMADALLELKPRPDAVLIGTNQMTLGAFRGLLRRGVVIPDDLAIIGYDDFSWTEVVRPALTVVSQPAYEVGRRVIERLLNRILGLAPASERIIEILSATLIVREST